VIKGGKKCLYSQRDQSFLSTAEFIGQSGRIIFKKMLTTLFYSSWLGHVSIFIKDIYVTLLLGYLKKCTCESTEAWPWGGAGEVIEMDLNM
jgi:hypothetical protein